MCRYAGAAEAAVAERSAAEKAAAEGAGEGLERTTPGSSPQVSSRSTIPKIDSSAMEEAHSELPDHAVHELGEGIERTRLDSNPQATSGAPIPHSDPSAVEEAHSRDLPLDIVNELRSHITLPQRGSALRVNREWYSTLRGRPTNWQGGGNQAEEEIGLEERMHHTNWRGARNQAKEKFNRHFTINDEDERWSPPQHVVDAAGDAAGGFYRDSAVLDPHQTRTTQAFNDASNPEVNPELSRLYYREEAAKSARTTYAREFPQSGRIAQLLAEYDGRVAYDATRSESAGIFVSTLQFIFSCTLISLERRTTRDVE